MRKNIGFESKEWERPGQDRPGQVARMRKNGLEKTVCPALQIGQAGPAPLFLLLGAVFPGQARLGQARPAGLPD